MSIERDKLVIGLKCFVEGNLIKDDFQSPYLYTNGIVTKKPNIENGTVTVLVEASHREISEELDIPIDNIYYIDQSTMVNVQMPSKE